jgi:hypothetical protein
MIAYRHQNPNRNSKKATGKDEEVLPAAFFRGRIVWVGEAGKRQQYICTGKDGVILPLGEYRELKKKLGHKPGSPQARTSNRRQRMSDLRAGSAVACY